MAEIPKDTVQVRARLFRNPKSEIQQNLICTAQRRFLHLL